MCEDCRAEGSRSICAACAARVGGRWVEQIPFLGVAMMVHGGLITGLALTLIIYGGFLAGAFADLPERDSPVTLISSFLVGGMLGVGLLQLVPGLLQLYAGWQIRRERSRVLGIVALGAGLLTVAGCYCAPTSAAMLVWGAIVLFSDNVKERFQESSR